ncbi:hypothetical protein N7462_003378 [Penicillium macrosclerotiorum]|uniref:uncharacterized protein n=1 Tax=Penicillium macrosclerotiorum TaxID=303699 RepID=UPI002546FF36|nr:uncharacterized protein N7462_003378 [Penicillium macrosclerotiorum]KAJ5688986.1 hypothetical protein N7462_003378 [Penicillium macrosclerotiorum]
MGNFTIVNGQVYTPGLAIVDAPQPNTPLGGDNLQVAIDVSGNGQLSWPPSTQSADAPTRLFGITLFLTSESLSHNFTISNGTEPTNNSTGYVGPVLDLEPSSTVKHVNWIWPECLVGDGDSKGSDRGAYNISMHQSFRWNGTDYYTVFDLPISVTNSIPKSSDRVDCDSLENKLLSVAEVQESSDSLPGQPWLQSGVSTGTSTGSSASATQTNTGAGVKRAMALAAVGTALTMILQLG